MKRILIIEDDIKLREYIRDYLVVYDYEVQAIIDFNNIKEQVQNSLADLILLDINLPKFDGFYFLKTIRKKLATPIIIVSARSEEAEQIRGIEMGADDYVTKPFSMGILLAKINAVLRRYNSNGKEIISVKGMNLICESMQLKINEKTIELSKNEYKLLRSFMKSYGNVVSREELLEELWDENVFVDDNTLTVNITRLKKKLKQENIDASIITKRELAMSLSKILMNTLKKEKVAMILFFLNTVTILLFYYFLYGAKDIIYPAVLTTVFLVCYLIYKFFTYRKLYMFLQEGKQSPQYKNKGSYVFEDILDVLREIHNKYMNQIYSLQAKYQERDTVLAEWIHNMKTAVSVIELATEKGTNEVIADIAEENKKLQKNLEGALNIFRLQSFEKDYVPERINLKGLVTTVINNKKRNFIYGRVFPRVNIPEMVYIYTDKKWAMYVIEQIITNAIKYSLQGEKVLFYTIEGEEIIKLFIEDRGIGIRKEELCRVFDAFYTGSNGRIGEKSSGIGLYMCKNICEMLDITIDIQSEEGKGTTVSLTFHSCKV